MANKRKIRDAAYGFIDLPKLRKMEKRLAADYKVVPAYRKETNSIFNILATSEILSDRRFELVSTLPIEFSMGTFYILINSVQLYPGQYYAKKYSHGQKLSNIFELEVMGAIRLEGKYGQIFMRPETWIDRISDHFVPVDIDFSENPEFSRQYYLLANKKENAELLFTPAMIKLLEKHNGLALEVKEDMLLILYSNLSADEAIEKLPELTQQLAEIVWA